MQNPDCLWCDKELTPEEAMAGNLCSGCQQVTTGIPGLPTEQLDKLPFGVIQLNKEGTIIAFNTAEERFSGHSKGSAIGLNFFAEIAPCSDVKEFRGRFEEFLNGDRPSEIFDYVYYFKSGVVKVRIMFQRVNNQLAFVLSSRKNQ